METRTKAIFLAVVASVALLWIAGQARAQRLADEPVTQGQVGVADVTALRLNYQGRLTDPTTGDVKPDGMYAMSFRLYDVETGGSPVWTETKDVSVQNGVFNTVLGDINPLNHELFNGQALWLGVKVNTDAEATPRQQLLPVVYALSLVPGAVMEANSTSPVFQVNNTGSGTALQVSGSTAVDGNLSVSGSLTGGSHTHAGADITSGTVSEPRIASTIARDAEVTSAISTHSGDANAHHTRYTNAEAWNAVLANDGSGSDLDADLLDGQQAGAFASSSHSHDHGSLSGLSDDDHTQYFHLSQNEILNGRPAFNGGTSGATSPFTVDSNTLVTSLNADLLDGQQASAFASASHDHWGEYWSGNNSGYGLSVGNSGTGDGIRGYTSATTYNYAALYGVCDSTGTGVYGLSSSGWGGFFESGTDHSDLGLGGLIGRISTDPFYADGDTALILSSNGDIHARLDNDGGENHEFRIASSVFYVFTVNEDGDTWMMGDLGANGTKSAVVDTEHYEQRELYALESPEVWFEDFGVASLEDGKARVIFEPIFAETVNLRVDYHVFVTPLCQEAVLLFVTQKDAQGFTVQGVTLDEKPAICEFDYRIVAKRLGYEDVRLKENTWEEENR